MDKGVLLEEIEKHRHIMVTLAHSSSYSDPKVIELSMKLDYLLNQYQTLYQSHQKKCQQE